MFTWSSKIKMAKATEKKLHSLHSSTSFRLATNLRLVTPSFKILLLRGGARCVCVQICSRSFSKALFESVVRLTRILRTKHTTKRTKDFSEFRA